LPWCRLHAVARENREMISKFELIRKVNSCLVTDADPPHVDSQQWHATLSDDEINEFMDCSNSEPPTITGYRGRFYVLEHKVNKHFNHRHKCITVMRDDEGEIHTILADGSVLWTEEEEPEE